MRQEVDASRALGLDRAEELADARYEDAQRFGAPALDEFADLASEAESLADEIAHGLEPIEGRRRLDALLARQTQAGQRQEAFRSAAESVAELDDDPDATNEAFLRTYPDARTEFSW
jgi:hypothetical protein